MFRNKNKRKPTLIYLHVAQCIEHCSFDDDFWLKKKAIEIENIHFGDLAELGNFFIKIENKNDEKKIVYNLNIQCG